MNNINFFFLRRKNKIDLNCKITGNIKYAKPIHCYSMHIGVGLLAQLIFRYSLNM